MKIIFTPNEITELKSNEIFVFGSNLSGEHLGGAAKQALDCFGAINGNAIGIQGKSYAIPTLSEKREKLSLDEISKSIDELYIFADENPDLNFLVTKIGCGIAGFTEKEIGDLFKSKENRFNVILPMEFSLIKGFKGFDKGFECRGFKFEENQEFVHDGSVKACKSGFHFCSNPFDVFNFYRGKDKEFSQVDGYGKIDIDDNNSKVAVSNLKINAKLNLADFVKIGIEYTNKKVEFFRNRAEKLIEKSIIDSSVNSGLDYSVNSGRNYSVNSGLDYSVNSGLDSSVNSGLDSSVNSGRNSSVCAGRFNSEIKLEGINSFGIAGKDSKIKGKIGCAICLVEYDDRNNIIGVKSALIDGKKLKEDTFYYLKNGKFVEQI